MKKILALLLALVMVLSLAACGSNEEKAEEPQQETTSTEEQKQEETADEVKIDLGSEKVDIDEKAMNRAGGVGDVDFSNLPATQDKAQYLSDGRLQLTSSGLNVIFDIPFGWLVLTQDAINQQDDYRMFTDDPAGLVSYLQSYENNAVVLASSGQQMMVRVYKDEVADLVGDLNDLTEDDLVTLRELLIQGNSGLADVRFDVLGDRVIMAMDYRSYGFVAIGTVTNGRSVYFLLNSESDMTEEEFNELVDFIEAVEYK